MNTMPLSQAVRNGHDIVVAFDVNQIDSEKIAGYVTALDEVHEADSELLSDTFDTLGELVSRKGLPITDRVRMLGDEAQKAYKEMRGIGRKTKELETKAEAENVPMSDNYYSILSRTFSLMNRTISMLSVQLYKPDVLVNMNFDSYGAIPDYAKGEEIAAKGRELMSGALDEYESRATSPASPA